MLETDSTTNFESIFLVSNNLGIVENHIQQKLAREKMYVLC
ncbi:hypothetical protein CIPAW_11G146900 [Carya illinoinensis]|uniref:Uncharacterized protein n=1 Tax=Carya illinoinensis TaxID=32201 RepID=A0A8T1P804_CARIL|nr:hypothetical protein CIPAW_11G146900 [Carya illinoinensis]